MSFNLLIKYIMMTHIEKPVVIVLLVCVLHIVCLITCIQAVSPQLSENKGPEWHYAQHLQSEQEKSKNLTEPVHVPADAVSPVKPKVNVSNSNITGVCTSAPCDSVESGLLTNTTSTVYSIDRKWNPEALLRGSYVFLGLSAIVLVYVGWKSMGKKKSTIHRYGVIPNHENMELANLDSEDGEDDTTHFDLSIHRVK